MKIDELGRSPLHYAVIDLPIEEHSKAIHKLVKEGANPNLQDKNGWTPLHFSAQKNSYEGTNALLENGAEIDTVDSHGNTALWRAVFSSEGNGKIIELLLKAGSNKNLENNSGTSPLSLAKRISNYDIEQFFK